MKIFFSTEEVAQQLEIPITSVDFYVRTFRINILKVGKNRKYSHTDIEKLQKIVDLIHKEGFTIEGAKEKLKLKVAKETVNDEVINRLKEIKKTLEYLKVGLEQ
ncbi:MerR family transcriptional regulator [Lacihabitans sp. CCS-44]|uniref:MerR family transcriptional regulator n=1 Tax=Lacihabitans sp. CCS-44 TaxID=2487331 RepID=UPI0020CDB93F|nr:MerR family transcriptional regulator [Lacihabitans sp. CCS-44]MCP9754248.1 MerR family transcriptional regulator [Lacihabitans sp. CCS-44]